MRVKTSISKVDSMTEAPQGETPPRAVDLSNVFTYNETYNAYK
jgi:hypothetical protein